MKSPPGDCDSQAVFSWPGVPAAIAVAWLAAAIQATVRWMMGAVAAAAVKGRQSVIAGRRIRKPARGESLPVEIHDVVLRQAGE